MNFTVVRSLGSALLQKGWASYSVDTTDGEAVRRAICELGRALGVRVAGRDGAVEETLRPVTSSDAHTRSLSAMHGLGCFPFHVELSHRRRPCRYILLGCLNSGTCETGTKLIDWKSLTFSPTELQLLQDAPILIRNGRNSFYSTFLSSDRAFLRFDPGCLETLDDRGRSAHRMLEERIAAAVIYLHKWRSGDVLIVDNWRMLHARDASGANSGRALLRMLIDAQ